MTRCSWKVCLALFVAIFGCETSTGGGGGAAGLGGTGGDGGTGAAGAMGGNGGTGGLGFTSVSETVDSGLAYRLARCQCPDPMDPVSENVCLSSAENLGFSERQEDCLNDVAADHEIVRDLFDCFLQSDLDAIDCVEAVVACDETALAACEDAHELARDACPEPSEAVVLEAAPCIETTVEDAVDALFDSLAAGCDCSSTCVPADQPGPDVEACIVEDVRAQADALGDAAPEELGCAAHDVRRIAVCFGNTIPCDGPTISCAAGLVCDISLESAFEACIAP